MSVAAGGVATPEVTGAGVLAGPAAEVEKSCVAGARGTLCCPDPFVVLEHAASSAQQASGQTTRGLRNLTAEIVPG
jgi:hypothetical protein